MKQNDIYKILVIFILVVAILSIFGIIIYKINNKINKEQPTTIPSEEYKGYGNELVKSCNNNNCQINVDTDPVDNIKNVVKQTILLEEHLIEKNNSCHECIITHFLHCLALLEEAIKISHKNIKQYPFLQEAHKLYKELFEEWSKNKQNYDSVQNILEKLRKIKKKLLDQYYII